MTVPPELASTRSDEQLRRYLHQLTVLLEVNTRIAATLDPDAVVATTLASLGELLTCESAAVHLAGSKPAERGAARQAMDAQQTIRRVVRPGLLELAVPLRAGGRVLGALDLNLGEALSEEDVKLVELLAGAAAVALHNAYLYQETQRLATTDSLTGLSNYRHFHQVLELEVQRARRRGYPIGLVLMDMDHFKDVNDRHGHPVGDHALRLVADDLRGRLRRTDVIARVGGEEFAVLLPGASLHEVATVAEKVRAAVEQLPPVQGKGSAAAPCAVTLSAGGVSLAADVVDATLLVNYADQALYQAKREGRNQVRLWTGPPVSQ
jgi:diguanylate cyclase (GGDEF)-like protein